MNSQAPSNPFFISLMMLNIRKAKHPLRCDNGVLSRVIRAVLISTECIGAITLSRVAVLHAQSDHVIIKTLL